MKWKSICLEEITRDFISGGTPDTKIPEFWSGTVPWITGADVVDRKAVIGRRFISKSAVDGSATNIVPKGSILLVTRTGVGKIAIAPDDIAISQDLTGIVLKDGFVPHFAMWAIYSQMGSLQAVQRGATIKGVLRKDVERLPIPFTGESEQRRIVELLEQADVLRRQRAEADQLADRILPALFHKMFGDPMDNTKGWPLHSVSSFVKELYGGRSLNPAGANGAAGRYRVLKISAVTWGEFKPEESKPVSADYEPPESHLVRAGDLLFSRANTTELVAATSYVFDTPSNLLLPDKLWRFVWKQPQSVEPLFVWWLFQAPSVRRELGQRATGTGGSMKNISKPKVMTLEVPVPPHSLQKEFAKRVTEIRELRTTQVASRQNLEKLFRSMLHRAFTGELTAKWREAHLKELLAEMEIQSRLLRTASKNN